MRLLLLLLKGSMPRLLLVLVLLLHSPEVVL
jgi:hypothetical protein